MNKIKGDVLILGAGIVGLSIAYRLLERGISKNIIVIEKEKGWFTHLWEEQWGASFRSLLQT